MRFYHSVAIKIKKDDLLEVLGLNQIVKFFLGRMRARHLCVKVCIKWLMTLFLDVRLRETRPMGLKLTKIKGLILICLYHCLVNNTGGLLLQVLKKNLTLAVSFTVLLFFSQCFKGTLSCLREIT